ncbi:hypothetical protein J4479_01395 [Candidatus Woesearchaeota archaeon]|nr:hypothetical protein [Candidatus Woesearchaeota archaeon]
MCWGSGMMGYGGFGGGGLMMLLYYLILIGIVIVLALLIKKLWMDTQKCDKTNSKSGKRR